MITQFYKHHYRQSLALYHKNVVLRSAIALTLFIVPALLFAELAENILANQTLVPDRVILEAAHTLSSPALDTFVSMATNLGGTIVIPAITFLIGAWCWHKKYPSQGLLIILSVGGASLISLILKMTFARTRPDLWTHLISAKTYSFPSGHAVASMSLAASIVAAVWYSQRWRKVSLVVGTLYVLLIAFTRLYAGVHYPSDIIGGWLLALAWTLIVTIILDASPHRRTRPAMVQDGPLDKQSAPAEQHGAQTTKTARRP